MMRLQLFISWKWVLFILLLCSTNSIAQTQCKDWITQSIIYQQSAAAEVYLVWGVNNWQWVPDSIRPANTSIKNDVMYTLMAKANDSFIVKVKVSPNDRLDYGFLITKDKYGATLDFWEADGKQNFCTIANPGKVVKIKSKVTLNHWKSFYFLVGISIFFGIYITYPVWRKWKRAVFLFIGK